MRVESASISAKLLFLLCVSLSFVREGVGQAANTVMSETPALHEFQQRYQSANALQATFLERYRENGRVVRVESGDAYFLKPGKMRWDYQAPEKDTFLVDGKYVWFYSPADHTATRVPAKQSEDWRTPLAFLTSHMKLSRLCNEVSLAQNETPAQPGGAVYRCQLRETGSAKEPPSRKAVLFEISPQSELSRIVIPQEGGIEIEFSFAGWRWNPPLEKSWFEFVPPRGVAIVDGLLPDTPGLRQ